MLLNHGGTPAAPETASFDAAAQASFPHQSQTERPAQGVFILPGGYCDDEGVVHREVQLEPLTGHDEDFLAKAGSNTFVVEVVTGLLSRCLKRVGLLENINASLVRKLLVGDRDYLMIKLRELSLGTKMDAVLACPHPLCAQPMDVTVFLDEIPIERKPVTARYLLMQLSPAATYVDAYGGEHAQVEFRLPTGADQEDLAPLFHVNQKKALDLLFARCVRRIGEISEIDETLIANLPLLTRHEIDEHIKESAPRVEIELGGDCPECHEPFETPFNFLAFFSTEMGCNLSELERDVHFLAWHYHWSENSILSLTRRKRQRYIELLQEELERFN